MKVTIGKLNKRITIRKKFKTVTQHGVTKYDYVDFRQIWADVTGNSAKYLYGQAENINEIFYKIIIRKTNDIHIDDIIVCDGRQLKITCEPVEIKTNPQYVFVEATELVEQK